MVLCYFNFTADCGDLPVVPDSTHDANPSYSPGSTVVYTCDMGFEFTGLNSTEVTAVCRDDDMWSDIPDCEGEFGHDCHRTRQQTDVKFTFLFESFILLTLHNLKNIFEQSLYPINLVRTG